MATHSSIPAWRTPWTEETGGPWSMGLQRVGYNCNTKHLILPELCLQCQFCNHMETFSILLIPNFPDKAPWDPRLCRVRLPGHWHPWSNLGGWPKPSAISQFLHLMTACSLHNSFSNSWWTRSHETPCIQASSLLLLYTIKSLAQAAVDLPQQHSHW